jgi:hypothetical protein
MTSVSQAAAVSPAAAKVTRIVFVGKEHPCDCTRKALDAGWAALQRALGTPSKVPVEKLQVDTDGSKVDPYRNQKPIMALPAIYFLDGRGTVLELLQGAVTTDQIAGVLQARWVQILHTTVNPGRIAQLGRQKGALQGTYGLSTTIDSQEAPNADTSTVDRRREALCG